MVSLVRVQRRVEYEGYSGGRKAEVVGEAIALDGW